MPFCRWGQNRASSGTHQLVHVNEATFLFSSGLLQCCHWIPREYNESYHGTGKDSLAKARPSKPPGQIS